MTHVEVHDTPVPRLGLGTWELTGDEAYRSVRHALDIGYRHVDTAQLYDNEEEVGRALADSPVDRDEVFVTTKVWWRRARPGDVRASHEDSLRRLGTDHVDLLLLHWPNEAVPVETTVEAMDELRQEGMTRLIGLSNHTAEQVERAAEAGPVACNQVEYHALLDQDTVLEAVRERDMVLAAYSPLAKGGLVDHPTLRRIGEAHSMSAAQVALTWLLRQERVVALPRSGTAAHIEENLGVLPPGDESPGDGLDLSSEEVAIIDALPKNHRVVDPPFAPEWD